MTDSLPQWDPCKVLKIDSIFTCSGWAHSKGRKCCNRIAIANRELATDIMEDMSLLDVRSADFKSSLKSLATPLLCRAYHVHDADQHTTLQKQWAKRIETYKVTVSARHTPSASASRYVSRTTAPTRHETTVHVTISIPRTPTPTTQEWVPVITSGPPRVDESASDARVATSQGSSTVTIETLQEELSSLRASMAALIQRDADSTGVERNPSLSTSASPPPLDQSHQNSSHGIEISRAPTVSGNEHLRSNQRLAPQHASLSSATLAIGNETSVEQSRLRQTQSTFPVPSENLDPITTVPASQSIPNITPRDQHPEVESSEPIVSTTAAIQQLANGAVDDHHQHDHRRKPVTGDCAICCENMSSGGNLSWCKAQCGQNFHADCVGIWLATSRETLGTCPYCRAHWEI